MALGAVAFELMHADKQKPWSDVLHKLEMPLFQAALTDSVGNPAAFTQLNEKLAFFYDLELLI